MSIVATVSAPTIKSLKIARRKFGTKWYLTLGI